MRVIKVSLFLLLTSALVCSAQVFPEYPESAHVNLYFPHFADGGPAIDRWRTTFTFVNTNAIEAFVRLWVYGDNGQTLALNFTGANRVCVPDPSDPSQTECTFEFTVPPNGKRVLESQVISTDAILVGWAYAETDMPLQATVAFREFRNGAGIAEIAAQPHLPTLVYTSAATNRLGVALANPWPQDPTFVDLFLYDSTGALKAERRNFEIPMGGHVSGVLGDFFFPGLPADFTGVLRIEGADWTLPDSFVAWTLGNDFALFSTLPPGNFGFPLPHWDRLWLTWTNLYNAAAGTDLSFVNQGLVSLNIDDGSTEVDAFANGNSEVAITQAMAELMGDSESELAYIIGHALGHIYQRRNGGALEWVPGDAEADADQWAIGLMVAAGYDPYGGAGALGKLVMATNNGRLTSKYDDLAAAGAFTSVSTRFNGFYEALQRACPADDTFCGAYRGVIHPHFPGTAPMKFDRQAVTPKSRTAAAPSQPRIRPRKR